MARSAQERLTDLFAGIGVGFVVLFGFGTAVMGHKIGKNIREKQDNDAIQKISNNLAQNKASTALTHWQIQDSSEIIAKMHEKYGQLNYKFTAYCSEKAVNGQTVHGDSIVAKAINQK